VDPQACRWNSVGIAALPRRRKAWLPLPLSVMIKAVARVGANISRGKIYFHHVARRSFRKRFGEGRSAIPALGSLAVAR
jgi:hypothetical protein